MLTPFEGRFLTNDLRQIVDATEGLPDVVPLQPTNIWDNGFAALRRLSQIYVNIVRKATQFFRTVLAFTVQIMVPKPAKIEATSDTYRKLYCVEYLNASS